jgi:hypothetical protein
MEWQSDATGAYVRDKVILLYGKMAKLTEFFGAWREVNFHLFDWFV